MPFLCLVSALASFSPLALVARCNRERTDLAATSVTQWCLTRQLRIQLRGEFQIGERGRRRTLEEIGSARVNTEAMPHLAPPCPCRICEQGRYTLSLPVSSLANTSPLSITRHDGLTKLNCGDKRGPESDSEAWAGVTIPFTRFYSFLAIHCSRPARGDRRSAARTDEVRK